MCPTRHIAQRGSKGKPGVYHRALVGMLRASLRGVTTYTITVDWPAIHTAAQTVDEHRTAAGGLGYDGVVDAFGGSYRSYRYEERGLAGLVALVAAADKIAHATWVYIHRANTRYSKAEPHERARVIDGVRAAVRTCFALHDLMTLLAGTGIIHYDPAARICGITDTIQVTGLRWLAGQPSEAQRVFTQIAREFAFGDAPVGRLSLPGPVVPEMPL